jgi:DNA-binding NarL/FixJ family response regulator
MTIAPTVVLGHDDGLVRDIVTAACAQSGVRVLAEAAEGDELVALCAALGPDVVLTGDVLGGSPTSGHIARLASMGSKVVLLVADGDVDRLDGLLAEDVWGCLCYDASPQEIVAGILAVASGGIALDAMTASGLVRQWRSLRAQPRPLARRRPELTPREQEVLAAMAEGLAAKAIAARLGVALKTVENHKIRVFDKLGVRTQAHAVTVAMAYGLTGPSADPVPAADAAD